MSSTAFQSQLKMKAIIAAADPNGTAVAIAGHLAGFVSFRWQSGNLPPDKNANSAVSSVLAALHFSGSIAKIAAVVAI